MMRKFSEVLEEYLRLREALNSEDSHVFFSIPSRIAARLELAELAEEMDEMIAGVSEDE
jgi:site-specific recombinase XerC